LRAGARRRHGDDGVEEEEEEARANIKVAEAEARAQADKNDGASQRGIRAGGDKRSRQGVSSREK
jgi:hypothetical protein